MASVFDLLFRIADVVTPGSGEEPVAEADVADAAARARGESVTPGILANTEGGTDRPIVKYLDDDEQPEYVLRGAKLLISDDEGSIQRKYPTRETQVVVTDRRLLFVLGGHLSDDIWEVPFEDVREIYVDDDEVTTTYLVVDADRDGSPMTFFADVTLAAVTGDVEEAVAYVREQNTA